MKTMLLRTAALSALALPAIAHAQSTGSIEADDVVVVTASKGPRNVLGVSIPDSVKARGVLTQEVIERQNPGQTILNTINLLPGVSFTNTDAYGSAGGNIRIRGFDGNRVSLTFDGFPLNDSGNYAIYSNQQLDPELIEQVNVNLGSTDIDSPTAAAAGGTINYRTIVPSRTLSGQAVASYGTDNYHRLFGIIQPGELTSFGTRMFASASFARNDKFKGPGRIAKHQFNGRIYQPLGDNGDFISLAGHYNENRNNFYGNPSLSILRAPGLMGTSVPQPTGFSPASPLTLSPTDAQWDAIYKNDNDASCVYKTVDPKAPRVDLIQTTCTNFYGVRINPSNTGNARFNSRYTVADNVIFTLDAAYQYTLANGGGYTTANEFDPLVKGTKQGVDFNGDGDFLDRAAFYTPNTTNTRRWTVMSSLLWNINDENRVRIAYTYERARHRQTGEWTSLDVLGNPLDVFGGRSGPKVRNADGYALRQRDRLSIALLNKVAAQYIGRFMDDRLRVELGVQAPFFQRDLENYCYTQISNGFALCTTQPNPTGVYAPFKAKYKFDSVLPSAGLTFKLTPEANLFANYSKGVSMPRTDNLYRAPVVKIEPEKTDAFDLGLRYSSSKIQGMLTGWYIGYQNRILTSYDPDLGISIDRNVGRVRGYGVDANLGYTFAPEFSLYAFGSYNNSQFRDDVILGASCKVALVNNVCPAGQAGPSVYAPIKGKQVPETPEWSFGAVARGKVGPVSMGVQVKHTGDRFLTDVNDVKVKGYTLVDLDAQLSLKDYGLDKAYFQVNVQNLFNKQYFGNLRTQINGSQICTAGYFCASNSANPGVDPGAPRAITGTFSVGF